MKTQKRWSIFISAVILFSLVFAGSAAAKSDKVEICHLKGNGSYVLQKINANTLQKHLAHGDAAPGSAVPGQAGNVLSANCSIISSGPQVPVQTVPPAIKNGKKTAKVNVCHKRGNGTFILININGNALPAHILHGDGLPNGEIPNQPGKFFRDTCAISDVPQKELIDTVQVSSDGLFSRDIPTQDGQLYEIRASGTYSYILTYTWWADAEYFLYGVDILNGEDQYPDQNRLDLSINSCDVNTDWGSYQPTHVYTTQWTGNGLPLRFLICDTKYSDNAGFLTAEVWKVNW